MLNREQRRAYQKKIKKNSAASICPECGNLALFYTTSLGEKNTVVKCQICDKTILCHTMDFLSLHILKLQRYAIFLNWQNIILQGFPMQQCVNTLMCECVNVCVVWNYKPSIAVFISSIIWRLREWNILVLAPTTNMSSAERQYLQNMSLARCRGRERHSGSLVVKTCAVVKQTLVNVRINHSRKRLLHRESRFYFQ